MKYNLPDRILRELGSFAQMHSVKKIILFGSRARGTNTERSDIDIAVYGGDFDSFIPAFEMLKDTLVKKLDEAESDW